MSFKPSFENQGTGTQAFGGIKSEGPGYIKTGQEYIRSQVGMSAPPQLLVMQGNETIAETGGYRQLTLQPEDAVVTDVQQTLAPNTITQVSGSNVDPAILLLGGGLLLLTYLMAK